MILWFLPINTVKYSAILAGLVKLTGKQMYEKTAHSPSAGGFSHARTHLAPPTEKKYFFQW